MKKLLIILLILLGSMQTAWASFRIIVMTLSGKQAEIEATSSSTVFDIKARVQDKEGVPPDQFYLTFYGRVLDDNVEVGDYNIQKEDTLRMVTNDVVPTILLVANEAEMGEYWTTFYNELSFNLEVSEGTKVFAVSLDGTTLTATEVEDHIIKSRQAVVMKNTVDGNITLTRTDKEANDSYYANNSLEGKPYYYWGLDNAYVLNYKPSTGIGFYKLTDGLRIANNSKPPF